MALMAGSGRGVHAGHVRTGTGWSPPAGSTTGRRWTGSWPRPRRASHRADGEHLRQHAVVLVEAHERRSTGATPRRTRGLRRADAPGGAALRPEGHVLGRQSRACPRCRCASGRSGTSRWPPGSGCPARGRRRYVKLLKASYKAIHKADRKAIVIAGSLMSYGNYHQWDGVRDMYRKRRQEVLRRDRRAPVHQRQVGARHRQPDASRSCAGCARSCASTTTRARGSRSPR